MIKKYIALGIASISINSFGLCPTNAPMCDVNYEEKPIFLLDNWSPIPTSGLVITIRNDQLKKNIPYTLKCMIDFKNFHKGDIELLTGKWTRNGVEEGEIHYIYGNDQETGNTTPLIRIDREDSYIYIKHVKLISNIDVNFYFGRLDYPVSYDCVAYEEHQPK